MAVTATYGPYGVEINSVLIGGITSLSIPGGAQIRSEATSDEVYARFLSIIAGQPTARFSTVNVAAALGAVGTIGADVASNAVNLWLQKRIDGTTRATGSVHTKFAATKGVIVPMSLRCEYGGDAEIEYFVLPRSTDGLADPLPASTAQALPSGITDAERFTLPPADSIDVGGIALDHVRGVEIDFGIRLKAEGADNNVYPTKVWIEQIAPVITISGVDPGWVDAAKIPASGGIACTHANTNIYLQKRDDKGLLVGVGTAEHIKFTVDGLAVADNLFDAGETSIRIRGKYDGSTAPFKAPMTVDASSLIA